jgi:hypothetical protein
VHKIGYSGDQEILLYGYEGIGEPIHGNRTVRSLSSTWATFETNFLKL